MIIELTETQRADHSEAMLTHGWKIHPIGRESMGGPLRYEWRSPRGISGSDYISTNELAPDAAIKDAIKHNDYLRTIDRLTDAARRGFEGIQHKD